ncbi:MAG: rhodanese-like domain-containing protein [Nanoarchaeota archaeon]|nr:rhodanese-like domain-containing protein [Nanoarchaeota archaeon]
MKTLKKEHLKEMIDKKEDMVLVNVLPKEYFGKQHIPGSINIPVEDKDFDKKVMEHMPDKSKKVVVYCANSECQASPNAAKKLEQMGYTNVYDYEGGIKDYCETMMCATA